MFTTTDYDRLHKIMEESPEKKELLTRLLTSHQMTLSMISHEIRNPLTLVYSTLQLIESAHPEVSGFKYWSDMHQDIEYMILLLDELSSYNNGNRLHLTTVNSYTFFRKLALSFASSLINTNIQFVSKIDPLIPDIQCDAIKLREVFLNLLGNARDAVLEKPYHVSSSISDSAFTPFIHLTAAASNTSLQITIKDNGLGIPEERLANIFEPFVTYKKNGTGLGLAITSRIISAHNGTIQVSSDSSVGTTFTLTLPVKQNS